MIDRKIRSFVRARARNCCEYCGAEGDLFPFRLHIEHIVPPKHGGTDDADNLALACEHCNLHKGANLTGIDPVTRTITPLFSPRMQHWKEHFTLQGGQIVGLTDVGRATIRVLNMNTEARLRQRGYSPKQ